MFFSFPEKLKFTAKHKQTLSETTMGENGLGAILPFFDAALKLIEKGEISLTDTHQLTLDAAKKFNGLLPNPVELGLKRPIAKSYPHVLGLFLLLRASGLTIVDAKPKIPKLHLDKELYTKWQALNPTERYFSLLETWLLRGYQEILGERESAFNLPDAFQSWAGFNRDFVNGILHVAGKKSVYESLKYFPRLHNLGLLDLFGFLHIERGAVLEGQAWQIESIHYTPLGEAFAALLYSEFFSNSEKIYEIVDNEALSYGAFQGFVKAYFPEWRENISPIIWEFRQGQYIFKLSLGKIWRRLAIDAFEPLDSLANLILDSVDFDNDHLYQFTYRRRSGKTQNISHPYTEEYPDTSEIRVGNVPLAVGQSMSFLFDFGDNWEFELALEAVNPKVKQKTPEILESQGEAPEQYPYGDEDGFYIEFGGEDEFFLVDDDDDFDDEDNESDE